MLNQIKTNINLLQLLSEDSKTQLVIESVIQEISKNLIIGKPLLVFGNGGSAADALHISGELIGKFKKDRQAFNVICLNANPVMTSAWANDFEYETVFVRQIQAFGTEGGICWGISTSGNSKSITLGLEFAQSIKMKTIGMTGNNDSLICNFSDFLISVPTNDTPRVQELHLPIYHYICEQVEKSIYETINKKFN
jgi:D-sedoheptulose 7-phosphate isomerase